MVYLTTPVAPSPQCRSWRGNVSRGDAEAVQAEEDRETGVVAVEAFGREQEGAELGAVHAATLARLDLGSAHAVRYGSM